MIENVGNSLKNLIFTLTWMEKLKGTDIPLYDTDIVSNLMDVIDNTESRTQLAIFVKGLNQVLNQDQIPYDE